MDVMRECGLHIGCPVPFWACHPAFCPSLSNHSPTELLTLAVGSLACLKQPELFRFAYTSVRAQRTHTWTSAIIPSAWQGRTRNQRRLLPLPHQRKLSVGPLAPASGGRETRQSFATQKASLGFTLQWTVALGCKRLGDTKEWARWHGLARDGGLAGLPTRLSHRRLSERGLMPLLFWSSPLLLLCYGGTWGGSMQAWW